MSSIIIWIFLIHFLADFGLQTHEQAIGKGIGENFYNKQLFYHVSIYSLIWFIACIAIHEFTKFNEWDCILFTIITFLCHYTTDYWTSRIGKLYWEKKDLHNGFVVVGFDQMLHYLQLYFTFKLFL